MSGTGTPGKGVNVQDLSLHILDIAENAMSAGASRIDISVKEETGSDLLTLEVADNGRGMDMSEVERARDPFFTSRTTRRIGLGLPMLEEAAKRANGELEVRSTPGEGTVVRATFQRSHIDRQPLGNIAATITTLIAGRPDIEFTYCHSWDGQSSEFSTKELRRQTQGMTLNSAAMLSHIMKSLRLGEESLQHNP